MRSVNPGQTAVGTIETVNGQIDAGRLGRVLTHEHIFVRHPELELNYPSPHWDEEVFIGRARETMKALKANGIDTLVDVTVMGLGRDIRTIQRVAAGLDLNIVVATGYYTYKDLPPYFASHGPGLRVDMPEPLHDMFVTDIRDGIAGTGVKAAIIKIATDEYGFTPAVQRVFRAAATAHFETGAPITTHTSAKSRGGLEQQAFLSQLGVDLSRVVIGHCGDSTDIDYLRAIMDGGSTIGMDRFGMDNYCPPAPRIETVVRLCALGYADRMTLSHDAAVFSINSEPEVRARQLPNWHHLFIPASILPELTRRGVSEQQITQMMVDNPRRILSRR